MRLRHMVILAMTLVGSGLSAQTSRPGSGSNDILPFKATETSLQNGLRVIVVPTGFPNLVSVQVSVQTGSRNEVEPGKSGFAHFFEHLMFRGTPKTPPEKYRQIMAKAGARDNAGTGDDATHYYATFAKEDLDTILGVYADMFQNLSYPEADFKTEARAILGEYNKNSAEPLEKLFEVQRDHFYQAHTYKHTTMGFIKDIENMPNEYAYSKVFFERWYRPQFTTLIVAGDVTPDRVLPLVQKHWGGWKAGASGAAVTIPKEPPPTGPKYVHVPWSSDALPWVTVAFPGPAFDENAKDSAAVDMLGTLYFGQTSDLYKKLVVSEQKVDQLQVDTPSSIDSALFTVMARVKSAGDAVYVRDQILGAFASARSGQVAAARLAAAKSNTRYSFARTIDSTERVAAVVAAYVPFKRSYHTVNNFYRTLESLTPADLQATAARYFTDAGLIVATLSKDPLPATIEKAAPLASAAVQAPASAATGGSAGLPAGLQSPPAGSTEGWPVVLQKSPSPLINIKLLFGTGSAHDPAGKEGLNTLTAAMLTRGGSKALTIEQIDAALYPIAGTFSARADKEMTSLTGVVHRDNWQTFLSIVLPQLVDNGWRQEDFERVRTRQTNALVQDLRSSNEEELGKERLQVNIFRGTPYGHVALGTVAGLRAITLDDVKRHAAAMFTRANLTLGVSGDVSDEMVRELIGPLQALPQGAAATRGAVAGRRPSGLEIEILEKDTRAVAMSLGFPIEVTRAHPDFVALSVVRSWLGEHRLSSGQLYQRIREERGINYGDYAYIEAFPRGMFQFFPDPNVARSRQLFEIWIRPVVPENAHMTLRIALFELQKLLRNGLTKEQFEATRDYLMKNVYVMTARQDQQIGYALDSKWYGIPEFTEYMRAGLSKLTIDQVNAAIKRHLSAENLSIVLIAKDAQGLKRALVADDFSPIKYDGQKEKALLDEDKTIGALKLAIADSKVTVTPIAEVFAK